LQGGSRAPRILREFALCPLMWPSFSASVLTGHVRGMGRARPRCREPRKNTTRPGLFMGVGRELAKGHRLFMSLKTPLGTLCEVRPHVPLLSCPVPSNCRCSHWSNVVYLVSSAFVGLHHTRRVFGMAGLQVSFLTGLSLVHSFPLPLVSSVAIEVLPPGSVLAVWRRVCLRCPVPSD